MSILMSIAHGMAVRPSLVPHARSVPQGLFRSGMRPVSPYSFMTLKPCTAHIVTRSIHGGDNEDSQTPLSGRNSLNLYSIDKKRFFAGLSVAAILQTGFWSTMIGMGYLPDVSSPTPLPSIVTNPAWPVVGFFSSSLFIWMVSLYAKRYICNLELSRDGKTVYFHTYSFFGSVRGPFSIPSTDIAAHPRPGAKYYTLQIGDADTFHLIDRAGQFKDEEKLLKLFQSTESKSVRKGSGAAEDGEFFKGKSLLKVDLTDDLPSSEASPERPSPKKARRRSKSPSA